MSLSDQISRFYHGNLDESFTLWDLVVELDRAHTRVADFYELLHAALASPPAEREKLAAAAEAQREIAVLARETIPLLEALLEEQREFMAAVRISPPPRSTPKLARTAD